MTVFLPTVKTIRFYKIKRPLIELSRKEVTFLTTIEALPLSVDSTNQTGQSTRSQIRYLLLPLIVRLGFSAFDKNFHN
jgi:tRNA(Ile)-lysidine synthase TilS/MesJ